MAPVSSGFCTLQWESKDELWSVQGWLKPFVLWLWSAKERFEVVGNDFQKPLKELSWQGFLFSYFRDFEMLAN